MGQLKTQIYNTCDSDVSSSSYQRQNANAYLHLFMAVCEDQSKECRHPRQKADHEQRAD
jgi:hypothetical protein